MITIEQAIVEAEKNDRVCPQPIRWNELYELLPNRHRKGAGWEPAIPLILDGWWNSNIGEKQLRLREHLEWAEAHDALDQVFEFMKGLPEEEWYHGE